MSSVIETPLIDAPLIEDRTRLNVVLDQWEKANRQLVAKILSEFYYEGAFDIRSQALPCGSVEYHAQVGVGDYCFTGQWCIWDNIIIDPESIRRKTLTGGAISKTIAASDLLHDLKNLLAMTDEQVAEHVEDMNATLYSDCFMMTNKAHQTVSSLCGLSLIEQQATVEGHPKFAFNKGRRGWGINDLHAYAPEFAAEFQLVWVAIQRESLLVGTNSSIDWNADLNASVLSQDEQRDFEKQLNQRRLNVKDYLIIPVHPWQWQHKISMAFIKERNDLSLVYLGSAGRFVSAQLSIRTLSVHAGEEVGTSAKYDIKLPLTIMNTSCYRGIPGRYIEAGPYASSWIKHLCDTDEELKRHHTQALEEPASAYLNSCAYASLKNAPYRYHELLGVIWRESAESKLASTEHAYLMAMLFEKDRSETSVVIELIKRSGLEPIQWLERMFEVVVIPYYHLLVKHGISLIAHGQNVTLVCKDNVPSRILLKDFQGDMRLVESDIPELSQLPEIVKKVTSRLSEDLIIHDLQTGHFVTVLRFISPCLREVNVSEIEFYRCLAYVIRRYQARHPVLSERFNRIDLFKPKILRLGLNMSKFRHDTDKSSQRMLPDMDRYMNNPLYLAEQLNIAEQQGI